MTPFAAVNWLNSDKSPREQGISESAVLTLRKIFFSDQSVDRNDPVQLNLIYVQVCCVKTKLSEWSLNQLNCTPPSPTVQECHD